MLTVILTGVTFRDDSIFVTTMINVLRYKIGLVQFFSNTLVTRTKWYFRRHQSPFLLNRLFRPTDLHILISKKDPYFEEGTLIP